MAPGTPRIRTYPAGGSRHAGKGSHSGLHYQRVVEAAAVGGAAVIWWRRKCKNTQGIEDAEAALEREKKAGQEIQAKRPGANELADDLERHYRENNFSRLIEDAMHPRRRGSP